MAFHYEFGKTHWAFERYLEKRQARSFRTTYVALGWLQVIFSRPA